jgi:hypothetical protein
MPILYTLGGNQLTFAVKIKYPPPAIFVSTQFSRPSSFEMKISHNISVFGSQNIRSI